MIEKTRFSRLVISLFDVLVTLTLLFIGLYVLTGTRLWPVALFTTLVHLLLLVLIPTPLLAAAVRDWRRAAYYGLIPGLFAVMFGPLFIPSIAPAPEGLPLRVMTYNAGAAFSSPESTAALLRESGADIIALQEVSAAAADQLPTLLADDYPHMVLYGDGIPGIGIVSRYPIVEEERFFLVGDYLPHMRAVIMVDGRPLTFYNVHPPPPGLSARGAYISPVRSAEIERIAAMTEGAADTLILGDFNATTYDDDIKRMQQTGYQDAYWEVGWGLGLTFPAGGPRPVPRLVRIDYIWYSPDFAAERAWLGPMTSSDHQAVIADLMWDPSTE